MLKKEQNLKSFLATPVVFPLIQNSTDRSSKLLLGIQYSSTMQAIYNSKHFSCFSFLFKLPICLVSVRLVTSLVFVWYVMFTEVHMFTY